MLVLTDGSGYELGAIDIDPGEISIPVWLVHLGGELSLGYDDRTLEVIQASGGGVAGSLSEALQRLALERAQAEPGTTPGFAGWLHLAGAVRRAGRRAGA